jgi:hypothetical protein
LKYHRVLHTQTDLSFLLTEGKRQVENLLEGEKRRVKIIHVETAEEDTWEERERESSPVENKQRVVRFMLREHLINLIEVMIEKEIYESLQRTRPEHKVASLMLRKHLINLTEAMKEKGSLRIGINSLVISWLGRRVARLPADIPKFEGKAGEDIENHIMTFHLWCSSKNIMDDSVRLRLFQRTLTDPSNKWYVDEKSGSY